MCNFAEDYARGCLIMELRMAVGVGAMFHACKKVNVKMKQKVLFLILLFCTYVCVNAYGEDKKKSKAQQPTPLKTLMRDAHAAIKYKRDQAKNINTLGDALKRQNLSAQDSA